jgi:mannose-1-phosphate guanylyltransferase
MKRRFVVLLASGRGGRLAPLSTPQFPKQFLCLPGEDESLLQQSARAACELVPADHVIVVTTREYARGVKEQLRDIDRDLVRHMLIEPDAMGTAASVTIAAHYAMRIASGALLWVLPCDHDRRAPLALRNLREEGFATAQAGRMLAFGVRPTGADMACGYFVAHNEEVEHFHSYTDASHAYELLVNGHAWWNSGMFVFPAEKMLNYLQHLQPELYSAASDALHRAETLKHSLLLCPAAMREMPVNGFDIAVIERVAGLKMRVLEEGWNNLESWPQLVTWWQTHAAHVSEWDFGNGQLWPYSKAWKML